MAQRRPIKQQATADTSASAVRITQRRVASSSEVQSHSLSSPTSSHLRQLLFSFLHYLLQFLYSLSLLLETCTTFIRQSYDAGLKQCASECWRELRRRCGIGSSSEKEQFKRLPHHLAFSCAPHVLLSDTTTLEQEAMEDGDDEQHDGDGVLIKTTTIPLIQLSPVCDLLTHCVSLNIPEVTLFDHEDLLLHSYTTLVSAFNEALNASKEMPLDSAVIVVQCGKQLDVHHTTNNMKYNQIAIIAQGRLDFLDAATLFASDDSQQLDSLPVDSSSATSSSSSSIQSSSSSSSSSSEWRPAVTRHIMRHTSHCYRNMTFHLITLLGERHAEQVIVDQALSKGASDANEIVASTSSSSSSPHVIRTTLCTTIAPIPLTEPDLLLVLRRASSHHRALLSFPPWLLRVVEIMYAHDLKELIRGGVLNKRLHEFGRTVQRGGT